VAERDNNDKSRKGVIWRILKKRGGHVTGTGDLPRWWPKAIMITTLAVTGVFGVMSAEYVEQLVSALGWEWETAIHMQWGAPREEHLGGWGSDGKSIYGRGAI
jgi:hypothetical protein